MDVASELRRCAERGPDWQRAWLKLRDALVRDSDPGRLELRQRQLMAQLAARGWLDLDALRAEVAAAEAALAGGRAEPLEAAGRLISAREALAEAMLLHNEHQLVEIARLSAALRRV